MFENRARESEILDRPDCDRSLAARSYRFMESINRTGGGTRAVRNFFARELAHEGNGHKVSVLDLGTGGADIPLALAKWAARRGYDLEFTGVDHNAKAIELAREVVARARVTALKLEQADIFHYHPPEPFDYAIGSMFFHHFTDDEINRLIEHLRPFVRKALFINDLRRCTLNYVACYVAARRLAPEIRHDALLSVRRGFTPGELAQIAAKHDPAAVVESPWFCRVTGVVRFDREGDA